MSSEASNPPGGGSSRRADLKRNYKEKPPPMGVFAVRNLANGKAFIGANLNVQGALNRLRFELNSGFCRVCPELYADWVRHGADSFVFEVLDVLEPSEDPGSDPKEELTVLEALWVARLRPNGEPGYESRFK